MILVTALGVLAGLLMGLTGAGGAVLSVPFLVFALGWTVAQAAPVALLAVAVAALAGTLASWDVRLVRYRAALLMAGAGLVAAPAGLRAAASLDPSLAAALFGGVLLLVALRLWQQSRAREEQSPLVRICALDPHSGRFVWTPRCAALLGGTGAASGFLSGLLGVGGGFVVVPALRAASPLSVHSAVATSLLTIALTSAGTAGFAVLLGHAPHGPVAAAFTAGALAGMLAGRRLVTRIAGARLQQALSISMIAVSALMFARAMPQ